MGNQQKVAMVFGGSRGIGAAVAKRLAGDGFVVALTYVSQPEKAQEVVDAIVASGGFAVAIQADSADVTAIRAAVEDAVARFGELDVVVVNAGVLRVGRIDAFPVEDLDQVLNVNVRGVYLAIQAAVAQMHDGGRVITIGSNTAVRASNPIGSVYAMSKAAVASLATGLALDLAPRRITVNNIQPGPTETDMTLGHAEQLKTLVPLGRVGRPDEIAALVSWVAGKDSGYMTGASLTIDGGYVL